MIYFYISIFFLILSTINYVLIVIYKKPWMLWIGGVFSFIYSASLLLLIWQMCNFYDNWMIDLQNALNVLLRSI